MAQTTAANKKQQALRRNSFALELPKVDIKGIISVGGLGMEIDTAEHQETAAGQSLITKRPVTVTYGELTMKRALTPDKSFYKWVNDVRNFKEDIRVDGAVVLYDPTMTKEAGRWEFENAWPSKWTLSDLDAGSGEFVTEELVLQIERLVRKS